MPKNEYTCDCHPLNKALVKQTKDALPAEKTILAMADFFSIIGDTTRCQILLALRENTLCVCDLANVLSMSKSAVSHQLGKLKAAGAVKCERQGKQIFYSLDDQHIFAIFDVSLHHIRHKAEEAQQ